MKQYISIAMKLKSAREEAALTKKELAEKLNTSKSVISRIETNVEDFSFSTISKVAEALGKKAHIKIS